MRKVNIFPDWQILYWINLSNKKGCYYAFEITEDEYHWIVNWTHKIERIENEWKVIEIEQPEEIEE